VYVGAEGVRLREGDILENGERGFAQLELSGGTIAVFGPSSRIFLFRLGSGAEIVLLSGWLKGEGSSSGAYRYSSPLLSASTRSGTVVVRGGEEIAEIFVESGSANVSGDGICGHDDSFQWHAHLYGHAPGEPTVEVGKRSEPWESGCRGLPDFREG